MADLFWPGDERAGELFTPASYLAAMVRCEEAWLATLVDLGVAPASARATLLDPADVGPGARERLAEAAESGGNPVVPLLGLLRDDLRARLATAGAALSAARCAAAEDLAGRVEAELAHLAMPHARFRMEVRQAEGGDADEVAPLEVDGRRLRFGRHGLDDVEMLLAANTGSEPRPLTKGASGGELSRVMLALEVSLAATSPVPTFVFDEVDAGVGGKAGIQIGRRLAALAQHKQVLVVTHLPQVAAYGDTHVVVRKENDGSVTSSGLTALDETARERELSRMLAGLESSETAVAHARELLAAAAPERSRRG